MEGTTAAESGVVEEGTPIGDSLHRIAKHLSIEVSGQPDKSDWKLKVGKNEAPGFFKSVKDVVFICSYSASEMSQGARSAADPGSAPSRVQPRQDRRHTGTAYPGGFAQFRHRRRPFCGR